MNKDRFFCTDRQEPFTTPFLRFVRPTREQVFAEPTKQWTPDRRYHKCVYAFCEPSTAQTLQQPCLDVLSLWVKETWSYMLLTRLLTVRTEWSRK